MPSNRPGGRTELGAPATAALLTLLAEGRPLTNAEMAEAGRVRLTGETRRGLNDAKLVESTKAGRGFVHEITEDGAARCRELLTAATPAGVGSLGGALYAVLRGLGRAGIPLADLFPYRGDVAAPAAEQGGATVGQRIREAYRTLASTDGGYVRLVDLRAELADLGRADVDAELVRLADAPDVHLEEEPDRGSLDAAEKRAAVRIGREDVHMIKIAAG